MKIIMVMGILLASCSLALAQAAGGAAGGSNSGRASSAGAATGNSTGSTGSTLSNGSTISGTGGGPGPNTSNALNHGTTGNNLSATTTAPTAAQGAASTGNAVNTPAANQAQNKLSNPDTGILKKWAMKDFSNAAFSPEVIEAMQEALDAAIATLPHPASSKSVQQIAENILRGAKEGQRDPVVLRVMATLDKSRKANIISF